MKYIFSTLFLFFCVFSNTAYSFSVAKKLKYYSCTSIEDAFACNNKCVRGEADLVFKVNEKNNAVIELTYFSNVLHKSEQVNGCKVINSKNWNCESVDRGLKINVSMTDGIATTVTYSNNKPWTISCAK
jgi:hypothetical protein